MLKGKYLNNKEKYEILLCNPTIYKSFGSNLQFLLDDKKKDLKEKSEKIMEKEKSENIVLDKVIEILNFINNPEENFFHWNYFVNELRLNLTIEIKTLEEELEEIDPNLVYLYLINIIINDAKKEY